MISPSRDGAALHGDEGRAATLLVVLRPVVWREGRYSSYAARIGRIGIGGVSWRMAPTDKDWRATFGLANETEQFDRLEDAKAWVEARALAFVNALAAVSSPEASQP